MLLRCVERIRKEPWDDFTIKNSFCIKEEENKKWDSIKSGWDYGAHSAGVHLLLVFDMIFLFYYTQEEGWRHMWCPHFLCHHKKVSHFDCDMDCCCIVPVDRPLVNDFTLTRNAWVATTPKKAFFM